MAYSPPGGARHLSLAEREAWAVGRGPGLCWEDQSGPQRGQKSWCQDMLFLCVTCPATGLRFGEANPALGLHGSALACPPPWSLLHPLSIRECLEAFTLQLSPREPCPGREALLAPPTRHSQGCHIGLETVVLMGSMWVCIGTERLEAQLPPSPGPEALCLWFLLP